jgi:hypothetical protein
MSEIIYEPYKGGVVPPSAIAGSGNQGTWDDIQFGLGGAGLNTATGRIGIDPTEKMTFFAANARYPDEWIVINGQTKHGWEWGSEIDFHFHALQTFDATPNIAYEVRTWANFEQVPAWPSPAKGVGWLEPTYVGPRFANIFHVCDIGMSRYKDRIVAGRDNLSVQFQIVIYRDSADATGLWSAVDPYTPQLLINALDAHVFNTRTGSQKEYRLVG